MSGCLLLLDALSIGCLRIVLAFLGMGRMFLGTPTFFLGAFWLLEKAPRFLGTLKWFLGTGKTRDLIAGEPLTLQVGIASL
jgi:hypothetical protein